MKNTIARYFSVDKEIQEISIGVRKKISVKKWRKDRRRYYKVETLLNLANKFNKKKLNREM